MDAAARGAQPRRQLPRADLVPAATQGYSRDLRTAAEDGASTGIGATGAGLLLCALAAGKAGCGVTVLETSTSTQPRTTFTEIRQIRGQSSSLQKKLRWCVCNEDFDPLGRRSGKKGALLTDEFCRYCYASEELARLRYRLVTGATILPWALWSLSLPLPLIAVARLPFLRCCSLITLTRAASSATGLDLILCVLALMVCVDWNTFKSLCLLGHTFDELYRVEVPFSDDLYFDMCAYSTQADRMTFAMVAAIILDLLSFAVLSYLVALFQDSGISYSALPAPSSKPATDATADDAFVVGASSDRRHCQGQRARAAEADEAGEGCIEQGVHRDPESRRRRTSRRIRGHGKRRNVSQLDESGDTFEDFFSQGQRHQRRPPQPTSVTASTVGQLQLTQRGQECDASNMSASVATADNELGQTSLFAYALRQSSRCSRTASDTCSFGEASVKTSDSLADFEASDMVDLFHDPL